MTMVADATAHWPLRVMWTMTPTCSLRFPIAHGLLCAGLSVPQKFPHKRNLPGNILDCSPLRHRYTRNEKVQTSLRCRRAHRTTPKRRSKAPPPHEVALCWVSSPSVPGECLGAQVPAMVAAAARQQRMIADPTLPASECVAHPLNEYCLLLAGQRCICVMGQIEVRRWHFTILHVLGDFIDEFGCTSLTTH